MSEEAAFLEALKTNPADDTARLVYADWLDEHDEPQKAEYLRLVAELARGGDNLAEHPSGQRVSALAENLPAEWRLASAERFTLVLYSYADKVRAIKVIRELTGQGLGEAKATSEALPAAILPLRLFENALAGSTKLSKAGAVVRVHPSEQATLSDLGRYRIQAELIVDTPELVTDDSVPEEAIVGFADFLRTVGVVDPEAVARAHDTVLIADDLLPSQAQKRHAELRQLLPRPEWSPVWWISVRSVVTPSS